MKYILYTREVAEEDIFGSVLCEEADIIGHIENKWRRKLLVIRYLGKTYINYISN